MWNKTTTKNENKEILFRYYLFNNIACIVVVSYCLNIFYTHLLINTCQIPWYFTPTSISHWFRPQKCKNKRISFKYYKRIQTNSMCLLVSHEVIDSPIVFLSHRFSVSSFVLSRTTTMVIKNEFNFDDRHPFFVFFLLLFRFTYIWNK